MLRSPIMDTRSTKIKKALTEEDLETIRQKQSAEDQRLRDIAAVLESERAAMNKEREQMMSVTMDAINKTMHDMVRAIRTEVSHEIQALKEEVGGLRNAQPHSHSPPPRQPLLDSQTLLSPNDPPTGSDSDLQALKISLREATENVPRFNGHNIPLSQFTQACRRAQNTVPASYEKQLTKQLINKLTDRAYTAIENEKCDTVARLLDLLNISFGPTDTIRGLHGDLSRVCKKRHEHILDYMGRVNALRSAILDAERRERGTLDHSIIAEVDQITAHSFCDGLPLEFRLQLRPEHYSNLSEAFSTVKLLAKRCEHDRIRVDDPPEPPRRDLDRINNRSLTQGNVNRVRTNEQNNGRLGVIRCSYCKNLGHSIQECRKRQYNNSRQGNYPGPSSGPDPTRFGPSRQRPVRCIEAAPVEPTRLALESSEQETSTMPPQ